MYWQEPLIIRTISYPRFIGGPLDGYTDTPFRLTVRQFSPDHIMYSTIRHASCIAHERGGQRALALDPHDRPLFFQITANHAAPVQAAVERIVAQAPHAIDLNIACPAKNIIKSHSGSALMADRETLVNIVKILRAHTPMALTIKMRAGFKEPNASTIAQLLCDLGVDALAIHPRLQTQKFGGQLDLSIVKEIKESVTIPVLYSGGIHTFADAKTVYEQTGVDGFLIGRALLGQPWKLAQLSAHATGKEFTISRAHIMRTAAHHFERMCLTYGARSLYAFRKHAHYYIRGFTDGNELKHAFFSATSVEQVKELLQRHAGDCQ